MVTASHLQFTQIPKPLALKNVNKDIDVKNQSINVIIITGVIVLLLDLSKQVYSICRLRMTAVPPGGFFIVPVEKMIIFVI